jgi:Cytochrome C oxidase, cbb3-type, subunit III
MIRPKFEPRAALAMTPRGGLRAAGPAAIACAVLICALAIARTGLAESPGERDYQANCARCHGVDGKGRVAAMARVPGYMSVDLTRLSERHGGKFPREEVYDAIDGRKRFRAHFVGDMPVWGLQFKLGNREPGAANDAEIHRRISALVGYIESLQQK